MTQEKKICAYQQPELRRQYANAIRALTMDAIDTSKSGHPGAPLGMADMAESLWRYYFKHNPKNPNWVNRDRFVLSNGHASMLMYSILHLTGYDLSIDDIKKFRCLHSKTPGHPEMDRTAGVDMGTGPLGQGIATAVGMALAEKMLGNYFNRVNYSIVDHHTWVFLGDGCLMEGVSQEAISLAGTWKLSKLIALYDSNTISIDGKIDDWFTEKVADRFKACGWHVIDHINGHDCKDIDDAINEAMAVDDKPCIIICDTTIGYGSPNKAGKSSCHGSPMGAEENQLTRDALGWKYGAFEIPEDIYQAWNAVERGQKVNAAWQQAFDTYAEQYPQLAEEFTRRMKGDLSEEFYQNADEYIRNLVTYQDSIATRNAGKKVLNAFAPSLPELIGGSADLTGSVGTFHDASVSLTVDNFKANYIHYGVREFGMSTIMNGLALCGGFIPYGGTFLVFSDYAKNAIRLAALTKLRSIWVLTHDSIGVGEDGPTHQPIEQIAGLRLTPNVDVWRPCDMLETAIAWKAAITRMDGPTCLIMSRQDLVQQRHSEAEVEYIEKGAYILYDSLKTPDIILIATGSEVELAIEAAKILTGKDLNVRVVSMPCADVFDRQDADYKEKVLPNSVRARVAIEAASEDFWYKYVGLDGAVIGMTSYGESAPAPVLYEYFGFTIENIVTTANSLIK